MSENIGTLGVIGKHLSYLFEPFHEGVQDLDSFKRLLLKMGWVVESVPPTYLTLGNEIGDAIGVVKSIIENGGEDPEDYFNILKESKDVFEAIQALSESPQGVDSAAFLNGFKEDLFPFLLSEYLSRALPATFNFLNVIGVIKRAYHPADADRPSFVQYNFHPENLVIMLTDPSTIPSIVYDWGSDDFDFESLAGHFVNILHSINMPVMAGLSDSELLMGLDPDIPAENAENKSQLKFTFYYFKLLGVEEEAGLRILELPGYDTHLPGIALAPILPKFASLVHDLGNGISLRLSGNVNFDNVFGILIRPEEDIKFRYPDESDFSDLTFGVGVDFALDAPTVVFGDPNATRLQFDSMSLDYDISPFGDSVDMTIGAKIEGLSIVISGGSGDGFLSKVMGDGEKIIQMPLDIEWSSRTGLHFSGSAGLEIKNSAHVSLGPITFEAILISIKAEIAEEPAMKFVVGTDFSVNLGPFALSVQEIGISMDMTFGGGNAGPFDIGLGFKPPNGVGIAIDAGIVKGGGFVSLDYEAGKYTGVLQLSIKEVVNVIAIGIITTKGPNGEEGQFSLLLLITAEFTPIQLAFGFTLNGVGGLVGVNRTMNLEALRSGVRTNALDNILFPSDPVANATQIISDLETVFPQEQGRFTFGLMAKLGWGTPTLISIELGLMLSVPNPISLAILGVIKMALPTEEEAILKLQVNFVGIIDFEAKYITFDASLFDSKLLTFTLEGDMALRIKWGSESNFLFSIGGFHPSYTPPPLDLPEMRRLSIGLLTGNPSLIVSTYFAVTSNTVQFGAAIDFLFTVSRFKVIGFLHFDALFQFSPFYFNISLAAGLGVYSGNKEILSIHLSGMLEGPTPWHITGNIKFKVLKVINVNVSIETTWGENNNTSLPDIDVLPKLLEALRNKENWLTPLASTGDSPDQLVSLREIENEDGSIIAHPNRSLSVSQKVVPLDMDIDKFGTQNPADFTRFELELVDEDDVAFTSNELKEEFASDSFFSLNESEKLSRPSFERYNSGVEGTGSSELQSDYFREREVEYEGVGEPFPQEEIVPIDRREFVSFTKNGSIANSPLSFKNSSDALLAPAPVTIIEDTFTIVNTDDLSTVDTIQYTSVVEAQQAMQVLMTQQLDLADQLEIVPSFELELL